MWDFGCPLYTALRSAFIRVHLWYSTLAKVLDVQDNG